MTICFELSMPNVNTWNGKWSGQDKLYAIVKNLGKSQRAERKGKEIIKKEPYSYYWDDGWSARVKVYKVDVKEARRIRNASEGFCGYDWMVASIVDYGAISTARERAELEG